MASGLFQIMRQELTTSAMEAAAFMQKHITPKSLDENLFNQIVELSGEAKEFLLLTMISDLFDGANVVPKADTEFYLLEADLSDNVHPEWEMLGLSELTAGCNVFDNERTATVAVDKLNCQYQQTLRDMDDGDDYMPPRFYIEKTSLCRLVASIDVNNEQQSRMIIKRIRRLLFTQILTAPVKIFHGIEE